MDNTVSEETILHALRRVPEDRWNAVLQFLETLENLAPIRTSRGLLQSDPVGLWADRDDLGDSREFARRLRQEAEKRDRPADAS
jgi:hypothetical protein